MIFSLRSAAFFWVGGISLFWFWVLLRIFLGEQIFGFDFHWASCKLHFFDCLLCLSFLAWSYEVRDVNVLDMELANCLVCCTIMGELLMVFCSCFIVFLSAMVLENFAVFLCQSRVSFNLVCLWYFLHRDGNVL